MTAARTLFGLSAWCALTGCRMLEPAVARQVDGVVTEGRFIDPEAYAFYAAAALREARGELSEALELYRRAEDADGRGPEIHTRIGAVACQLRQTAVADRAFGAASRADADYGPLWFELARCRQRRGELESALRAALEAVRLDPERSEASLLAASLAEQRGDSVLAWQLRDGLATHARSSAPVQREVLRAALRAGEKIRAERARAALRELAERAPPPPPAGGATSAVQALKSGDLATAQREAERLLGADPGHADALVIALVIADLEPDPAAFEQLLASSAELGTPLSVELLSLLAELLDRRVGPKPAEVVRALP